jgi:hypothetical protein
MSNGDAAFLQAIQASPDDRLEEWLAVGAARGGAVASP